MASFTMAERKLWVHQAVRTFEKFWKYKLPVPVDPIAHIYRAAYSDKEWEALQILKTHRRPILSRKDCFDLFWTDDVSGSSKCPHVSFDFPDGIRLPYIAMRVKDLPKATQATLLTWITSVQHFRSLERELSTRCNAVMGNPTGVGNRWINRHINDLDPRVNTPGQLYRLWPEVQPLMLPHWKRSVQLASTKSPLPKRVGLEMYSSDGVMTYATPEQFRCEDRSALPDAKQRFKEINDIVLMVSLTDGVPRPDFPAFYGSPV